MIKIYLRGRTPGLISNTLGLVKTFQPSRTTYILRHKYRNPRELHGPCDHILQGDERYCYEVVEETSRTPKPMIKLLLTSTVEGFGLKGDVIDVKAPTARLHLLLPQLAVYATPEVLEKQAFSTIEKEFSSRYVPKTISQLSNFILPVYMNVEKPWTVESRHIRASFIKNQIQVPLHAIIMCPHSIVGPNMDIEGREFYITVKINDTEEVKVRCRLYHHVPGSPIDKTPSLESNLIPAPPIFPEDEDILSKMPLPSKNRRIMTGTELLKLGKVD